jgi:hypothetical protein
MADYDLSNRAPAPTHTNPPAPGAASAFAYIQRVPPSARVALARSDPDYLTSAFKEIERRDGSISNYLQVRLGVGQKQVRELRARLLRDV